MAELDWDDASDPLFAEDMDDEDDPPPLPPPMPPLSQLPHPSTTEGGDDGVGSDGGEGPPAGMGCVWILHWYSVSAKP